MAPSVVFYLSYLPRIAFQIVSFENQWDLQLDKDTIQKSEDHGDLPRNYSSAMISW